MRLPASYLLFFCLGTLCLEAWSENWPIWRGPRNDGTSQETGLPTRWNASENIAWRHELPGPGPSTPVIWESSIFLTASNGDDLVLLCLDTSGNKRWQRKIGGGNYVIRQGESNAASPSPSTDGRHIWAFTGTGVLVCFDFEGNEVWRTNIQDHYGKFNMYHGFSSSPLLHGDRLYLQILHSDAQYVVALDKTTGREIWKQQRPSDAKVESLHSYASPIVYRSGGDAYLLAHGSDYITAHQLENGNEIWRCGGLQTESYNPYYRFVATPVAVSDLIVVPSAKNGPVLGLNPKGARGEITTQKDFYHWKRERNTPDVPSPVVHDGLVYLCRENGVLICMSAKTGEEIYLERTHDQRHRGSPVYADGKIYLTAADGMVTVVKAGKQFEILSQNHIDERLAASIAIANGTLYLRTYKALYAIRDPS